MEKGRLYTRTRWRQEGSDPNEETDMVELTITQKIKYDFYCSACGQIDGHNRCRQESLDTEKKLVTKDWSKRFNISVFAMNVVDVWFEYQGITGTEETQPDF